MSRIAYREHGVLSPGNRNPYQAAPLFRLDEPRIGGQPEGAPQGHRVASVEGEIDEDLVDLTPVGVHRHRYRRNGCLHHHVGREQVPEHRTGFQDYLVQLEVGRLEDLLAAEGQKLLGHPGGSDRGLTDLDHVPVALLRQIGGARKQVAEPQDDSHHVVHFVRHPAGQPADCLHPLRPPEPLLGSLELGHVLHRHDVGLDPRGVLQHSDIGEHRKQLSGLSAME